jgi:membrane associated rhomboid family serine protease
MTLLLALLAIAAFGLYVLKPEERQKLLGAANAHALGARRWLLDGQDERTQFLDALRTRTKWPVATIAIVVINLLAFAMMPGGAGASFGPLTTNGEWWRLVTAVFVHRGLLVLLFDVGVIVLTGVLLERLVGSLAFALVFVSGGVLADCVHLSGHPLAIRTGAWGAMYALLGVMAVWIVKGIRTRSELSLPWSVLRLIGCVAALFALVSIVGDPDALSANVAAFVFGVLAGAVMMIHIAEATPAPGTLGAIAGAALAIALVLAIPSRGIADVRPEIARVLALEAQTTPTYDKAVGQFKLGATTAEALARMIDRQILPTMREAQDRLAALHGVPRQHQPVVADAEQYVRLRNESWDLRARALHTANMRTLRLADDRERESLEALERLKAADVR